MTRCSYGGRAVFVEQIARNQQSDISRVVSQLRNYLREKLDI